jgi:hypothetical protein
MSDVIVAGPRPDSDVHAPPAAMGRAEFVEPVQSLEATKEQAAEARQGELSELLASRRGAQRRLLGRAEDRRDARRPRVVDGRSAVARC